MLFNRPVFSRLAAGLLAGASLAALAVPAEAGTKRPVRWNTGGAVWTTTSKDFKTFFKSGEITDRAPWKASTTPVGLLKRFRRA